MTGSQKRSGHRLIHLALAGLVLVLFLTLPLPDSWLAMRDAPLNAQGRATLGVLLFCLVMWVTEPMPFHITGLLAIVLLALLKADSFVNLIRYGFGNETIAFFIGVLTMSACLTKSGLGERMALLILRLTGSRTRVILLGVLMAGAFLGMWVTTVAAAAMLVPLVDSIAKKEGLKPGSSRFGKALFIAAGWGSLIGGIGSPAGSGANPVAIGFIRDMLGMDIGFTDWMIFGVPCMLALIPAAWLVLVAFFRPESAALSRSSEALRTDFASLPPLSRKEAFSLGIFVMVILLWLFTKPLEGLLGMRIPTALPALLGACLFFVPSVTDMAWSEVQHEISWSGILLIASGVSLGMVMYLSGAAKWLASLFLTGIAGLHPAMQIFLVILVVAVLKLGLSSNTVTATVVIPIMISLTAGGVHPLVLVIPAAMTMNTAYMLVTSSPTTVITHAAGYYTLSDMARSGAALTLLSALVMTGVIYWLGSVAGIY